MTLHAAKTHAFAKHEKFPSRAAARWDESIGKIVDKQSTDNITGEIVFQDGTLANFAASSTLTAKTLTLSGNTDVSNILDGLGVASDFDGYMVVTDSYVELNTCSLDVPADCPFTLPLTEMDGYIDLTWDIDAQNSIVVGQTFTQTFPPSSATLDWTHPNSGVDGFTCTSDESLLSDSDSHCYLRLDLPLHSMILNITVYLTPKNHSVLPLNKPKLTYGNTPKSTGLPLQAEQFSVTDPVTDLSEYETYHSFTLTVADSPAFANEQDSLHYYWISLRNEFGTGAQDDLQVHAFVIEYHIPELSAVPQS